MNITLQSWEDEFYHRISKLRSEEIKVIQAAARFKALNEAIFFFSAPAVSIFIFVIHVASGGVLSPKAVYTTLTLMGIVQFILTKHVPNAIMGLSECYVSCQRAQNFLELQESQALDLKSDDNGSRTETSSPDTANRSGSAREDDVILSLDRVTCHWSHVSGSDTPQVESSSVNNALALSNVSFDFKANQIYFIIGKVGSGKSAFLQALARELPISEGSFKQEDYSKVVYASQQPWIMDGSVKENILMGEAYDKEWYDKVVKACGLVADIANWKAGDETIVGDHGVQCSGGQQSRIALARCLYVKDSQILLLDDPLSAVDTKVAHTIMYDAILTLGKDKCVILVTHQHQFIGKESNCILMNDGRIRISGTFQECMEASDGEVFHTFRTEKQGHDSEDGIMEERSVGEPDDAQTDEDETSGTDESTSSQKSAMDVRDVSQKEKRRVGIIAKQTWLAYGQKLGGLAACFMFLILFSITQASMLFTIVEVGHWAEAKAIKQNSMRWFVLILSLTTIFIGLSLLRAILSFGACIKASRSLHNQMLLSVLRAKIEFYDTNPSGRILNRFSADSEYFICLFLTFDN